jgi:sulfur-oxidizing protein SoxB
VGGFAHLATLVKRMKASRPGALLLDGGDTWQGSATSLWTNAQDMVDACKLLGVDVMTGHWEFTYGMDRVKEIVEKDFKARSTSSPRTSRPTTSATRCSSPTRCATSTACRWPSSARPSLHAHRQPALHGGGLGFGIQDENLQKVVDEARGKGAQVVVVLSHNGMDVDLKMASRVRGVDAILGGHTHDGVPVAIPVKNAGGTTLVTNAGSNGKFLGVLDFDVKDGKVADFRYRCCRSSPTSSRRRRDAGADRPGARALRGQALEKLAVTDGLLYRRGNFNGSWDQLICDALMDTQGAEIAFSPGFRWGTTLLPGDTITRELMMDQTAITYPYATLTEMTAPPSRRCWRTWPTTSSTPTPTTSRAATWCAWAA